jgi:carbon starvation protein
LAAGTLPPEKAAVAGNIIFNQRLDAVLAGIFLTVLWLVLIDVCVVLVRRVRGDSIDPSPETPYVRSLLPEAGHG